MLFQKHRCKNDQRRQYVRRIADSFVFFQFFTLMDSDTHAQRIKYMQTREYIRTCIEVEDKAFEGSKEKVEDSLVLSQRYLKQFVI